MKLRSLVLFLFMSFVFSCSSPQRSFSKGSYHSVVKQLYKEAEKGTLTKEEAPMLEQSIASTLAEEEKQLKGYLDSKHVEDWKKGYQSLDDIAEKQEGYLQFKQLNPNNLGLISIKQWDGKFSDLLYTYHADTYTEYYENFLATENKNYLIDAYEELDLVAHFDRGEINVDSLQREFERQGLRSILVNFKDESFNMFELNHLKSNVRPADSKWSVFESSAQPDLTAYVILKNLDKDDSKSEDRVVYNRDVVVGTEIQLDNEGEQIEVPVFENFSAIVDQVTLTYAVDVEIVVEVYWNKEAKLIYSESFENTIYDQEFENYMVDGDNRGLPIGLNLSTGSSFTSAFRYDYGDLIEELLESMSEDVEDYLESI